MITREQFEAHVRVEAEKAVPVVRLKHPTLKHYSFDLSEGARKLYIAARMEHEWPLVEAAQAVVDRWDSPLWKDMPHTREFIGRLRDALSPYTTKAAQ